MADTFPRKKPVNQLSPQPITPSSWADDFHARYMMDERDKSSKLIEKSLNTKPNWLGEFRGSEDTPSKAYGLVPAFPAEKTNVYTANNPNPYSKVPLQDDPQMELAVQKMQERYPELFKGVDSIHIGAPQAKGIGGFAGNSFDRGGAALSLGHSGGDYKKAMNTLRHELSHVGGLEDSGSPSAYDVGYASDVMNSDIQLPSDRKYTLTGKK